MTTVCAYAECPDCGGTGLYTGFMERKGEAVVCVSCGGTGRQTIRYKEFERRKRRNGVSKIRFGSGLILDNPGTDQWFSYREFEEKIKAPKA